MFLAVIFLFLSLFLYFYIIPEQIPLRASWGGDVGVDSRTFPYFTAVSMGLVSFGLFVSAMIHYVQAKVEIKERPSIQIMTEESRHNLKEEFQALVTYCLFLLYGILLMVLGFVLSTLVVPFMLLYFLGERKIWNYLGVYAFSAVLYVIFQVLLKVQLP